MIKSKMSLRRQEMGLTGLEFSRKLQEAGLKHMTESRVFRIESGRSRPTEEEREAIGRILNIRPWEINL